MLSAEGMLNLEPFGRLEAADFEAVIHDIQPYPADYDSLAGVIIGKPRWGPDYQDARCCVGNSENSAATQSMHPQNVRGQQ